MEMSQGKTFERPAAGIYIGTLVDVVDMPNITTQYGIKNKVRLHWILVNPYNGQPVVGKDGQLIEAVGVYNASMAPKAELVKKMTAILGQAPPVITSTEQLDGLLIGRVNVLTLVQNPNDKNPSDPYINVEGITPVQQGMPAPLAIPATYVRAKNRPKTQAGPQGPVQTYATPQAAQQAAQYQTAPGFAPPTVPGAPAVNLNAGAPAAAPAVPATAPAQQTFDPNARRQF